MNNLQLFEACLQHDEDLMNHDSHYTNIVFTPVDISTIQTSTALSQSLKNKFTAIREIENNQGSEEQIDILLNSIIDLLLSDGAQYNEFACFLHACDVTLNTIDEINKTDKNSLKTLLKWIIKEYKDNRGFLDTAKSEMTSAFYDDSSSRRNGKAGEYKIKDILTDLHYTYCENWELFNQSNKAFFFLTTQKNGIFKANDLRSHLGITYQFNRDKKKTSDVCIKKGNNYYVLEAKHLKEGGGSQDKQFQELLDLIGYSENNVSYVSFLDGAYWNFLLKSPALYKQTGKTQIDNIKDNLRGNTKNYFINTYGLKELFKENTNGQNNGENTPENQNN